MLVRPPNSCLLLIKPSPLWEEGVGATSSFVLKFYSCLCAQGSLLVVLGMELESVTGKASVLPCTIPLGHTQGTSFGTESHRPALQLSEWSLAIYAHSLL